MHGFFSRVTLSFLFLCVETVRRFAVRVFFSLSSTSSFFFSPPALVLSVPTCYLCLLTYCIYKVSPPRFFFFSFPSFCHCNLYQQSRCLNNAKPPFFIQSHVQFFYPRRHNCLSPQRNSWELGDKKAQTHFVWWWCQTRIQRAITQQSHTHTHPVVL